MSDKHPIRPSLAAGITHYLCMTLADVLEREGGPGMNRRTYLKLYGLAGAAEQLARAASRWYGNLPADDQELLEELEERYLASQRGSPHED